MDMLDYYSAKQWFLENVISFFLLFSPVMALFGKELLELTQSHHPAFD